MGSISIKELLHEASYNKDDRNEVVPAEGQILTNALILVRRVNALLAHWGDKVYVSSGYRPQAYNKRAGGAANSAHMTCEAVDLRDAEGKLAAFIKEQAWLLQKYDLYMEDPAATPTWCHLQTRKTKSGARVFKP